MKDFTIIGGGIGGCATHAMLDMSGHKSTLLEKEPYLGGCASTFTKNGFKYNSGATTFAAYEQGLPVYDFCTKTNTKLELKLLEYSHIVLLNGHSIKRYKDLKLFCDEINQYFNHKKQEAFWKLIKSINDDFFAYKNFVYSKNRIFKTAISFAPFFAKFYSYMFVNAKKFIEEFFDGKLSKDFLDFLDAQTIIVAQAKTDKINFLTAALALGYSFYQNAYSYGGMGEICNSLVKDRQDIKLKESVKSVKKYSDGYCVETNKNRYFSQNVVLNLPIHNAFNIFDDEDIKNYFNSYKKLDSKQSAFVVYFKIKSQKEFATHYQIVTEENFKYTISNSVFISFSLNSDTTFGGFYSVTASVHTMSDFWLNLQKDEYNRQKTELVETLKLLICKEIEIEQNEIIECFGATPKTFLRYINRSSLGGAIMTTKNQLFGLCPNDTPFKGLYCVGDTTFAAQGFPGVIMGVRNLECLI